MKNLIFTVILCTSFSALIAQTHNFDNQSVLYSKTVGSSKFIGIGGANPTSQLSLIGETTNTTLGLNLESALKISNWKWDGYGVLSELHFSQGDHMIATVSAVYSDYASSAAGDLVFTTSPKTSTAGQVEERMRIKHNGNIGIGTTNPTALLTVNGKILCEEIKVIADVPASDYVFEDNYNLLTLDEVSDFIKANKHLPEVPSAAEFKENGYKVGEMDDLLLRKIEELTLYIIELNNELEKLKKSKN